ncbi:hypothetical protein B0H16DRAFT_1483113 [Mycena metata]|uniref:Uncharacterized protein n=1 Tax=Mycena metata TaxID=1033252 RepID=A0AAD7GQ59_9AGAR|nr:hypothetical protein B0H16DRAFT_1483113 [Mycena metata]
MVILNYRRVPDTQYTVVRTWLTGAAAIWIFGLEAHEMMRRENVELVRNARSDIYLKGPAENDKLDSNACTPEKTCDLATACECFEGLAGGLGTGSKPFKALILRVNDYLHIGICETIFNDVLQSNEMSTLQSFGHLLPDRCAMRVCWECSRQWKRCPAWRRFIWTERGWRGQGGTALLGERKQLQDTTLEGLACNEVACHPAPGMGERRERPEYVLARVNRAAMDFGLIATANLLLGFKVGDVGDIQRGAAKPRGRGIPGMWPDCQAMDLSDFIVHLSSFSKVLSGDGLYFPLDLIASFALLAVASIELLTVVYHVPLCPIHASFYLGGSEHHLVTSAVAWKWLRHSGLCVASHLWHAGMERLATAPKPTQADRDFSDMTRTKPAIIEPQL